MTTIMALHPIDLKRLQVIDALGPQEYWTIYGPSLDRLIEAGLAEVDGGINDHAIGTMYEKVSLTEKGRQVLRGSAQ